MTAIFVSKKWGAVHKAIIVALTGLSSFYVSLVKGVLYEL